MPKIEFSDDALKFMDADIEFRLRYVLQEAQFLASHCNSDKILPLHISMAWDIVNGGTKRVKPALWTQDTGAAAARVIVSASVLPEAPSENISNVLSNKVSNLISDMSSSKEAATILSAITASVYNAGSSAGDSSGVVALLSQIGSHESIKFKEIMPGIVATLRSSMEQCFYNEKNSSYANLHQLIHIVSALVGNRNLEIESQAGEFLAITSSILLHTRLVDVKDISDVVIQEEVRIRTYAAQILSALVMRIYTIWPDVTMQAALVLLDNLSAAIEVKNDGNNGSTIEIVSYELLFGIVVGLAYFNTLPSTSVLPLITRIQKALEERSEFRSKNIAVSSLDKWEVLWLPICLNTVDSLMTTFSNSSQDSN